MNWRNRYSGEWTTARKAKRAWDPKKFHLEKKKKLLSTWSTSCSGFAGRFLEYIVIDLFYKYEIVHVISFLDAK